MGETGYHHSQQTDTRTQNQTLHVLTRKWVLNNENTWMQGGEHHTPGPRDGGLGEESRGCGDWGGIALGKIPNVDDGAMDAANHHHGTCIPM